MCMVAVRRKPTSSGTHPAGFLSVCLYHLYRSLLNVEVTAALLSEATRAPICPESKMLAIAERREVVQNTTAAPGRRRPYLSLSHSEGNRRIQAT